MTNLVPRPGSTNPSQLPELKPGWRVASIDELCTEVTSGGTPLRSNPDFYTGGQIDWFKTGELRDGYLYNAAEKITEKALKSSSAKLFPKDTILMAMYGDGKTITRLGMLTTPAASNQACCAMLPNYDVCSPRFLFYSLMFNRQDFVRLATGGAQRNLSGKLIRNFDLIVPPLAEQKRVAHILGTLDDKIELNRQMSATLEEMARALFKSWFIDFDPVRAKAEGRPTNLPPEIDALFPDDFEDSELGPVPRGWMVGNVSAIGQVVCGKTPPTSDRSNYGEDIPFITIPDMHGQVFATRTGKKLSERGAASQPKKTVPSGAIAVSCIATPGLVTIVDQPSQTNQQINTVVPSNLQESFYWYHALSELAHEIRAAGSGGSVLINLSTGRFSNLKALFPPAALRLHFHKEVSPVLLRLRDANNESHTLAAIRDSLLPKLISGDLELDGGTS
ncbi:MAG TPA: restriction endonuclease subunit S [Fimbriimonas sp.]|nr:restriction endonuclease subunit S [Fimbriimonas sp.]